MIPARKDFQAPPVEYPDLADTTRRATAWDHWLILPSTLVVVVVTYLLVASRGNIDWFLNLL